MHLTLMSVWYSLLRAGGPGGSASVGLASEFMSFVGMNSIRKWTPLLAATRVVLVDAITR